MGIIKTIAIWLSGQNLLEIIAFITGITCVWLAALNNIWNWPFALINTAILVYIFAKNNLYADMGQYTYLFISNIYGWYFWSSSSPQKIPVPIKSITKKQIWWSAIIIITVSPALGFFLTSLAPILHYSPASFPYLDSFLTVCSLIAQIFLTRRILQNWLLWVFVNLIYTGVYFVKDMKMIALLSSVYLGLAVFGYFDWRKDYYKQQCLTR